MTWDRLASSFFILMEVILVSIIQLSMMVVRGLFVAMNVGVGYYVAKELDPTGALAVYGLVAGAFLSLLIILGEIAIRRVPLKVFIGGLLGFVMGLLIAHLITVSMSLMPFDQPLVNLSLRIVMSAIFGYLGVVLGIRKGQEFDLGKAKRVFMTPAEEANLKILDTSVIIDGRIADVCETGFVEGVFVLPQFILQELQHVADSSDPLKRAKGRRGLDILHRIQKMSGVEVRIVEEEFPKIREVDSKLIALAKQKGAKIITNDFNLNKVASLHGVIVLNINDLSNAVKPVVLPGETLRVFILKEGKEFGQGVAYLDDGTMIVVENARKYIGKNVEVSVTSVLQTTAGRMIFTKLKEETPEREEVQPAGASQG